MADNKKSFLLYVDLIHTVNKLPDDKAGELFKLILSYVNDECPDLDELDFILQIAFEPIRQSLKRDLEKYHNIVERNRLNGKSGGRPKKAKKPSGLTGNPNKPKKADSDNGSVNEINKTNPRESYDYSQEREVLNKVASLFDKKYYNTEPKKQKWLNEIRLLIEVDKYTPKQIIDTITFGRNDDFWSKTFLSIGGIRKKTDEVTKFDKMKAKSEVNKPQASTFVPRKVRS